MASSPSPWRLPPTPPTKRRHHPADYFIPRTPQYTEEWLYQDENGEFPYAKKLVELAKYYGFDGYFINQEASIDSSYVPLFREMLQYMREQGIYIQWYDSITESGGVNYQNAFNSSNAGWIWNETNGRVADSHLPELLVRQHCLEGLQGLGRGTESGPLRSGLHGR